MWLRGQASKPEAALREGLKLKDNMTRKLLIKTAVLIAGLVAASAVSANAAMTLTLSDGTPADTKTYTDSVMSGIIGQGFGGPSFGTTFGGFMVSSVFATGAPYNGNSTAPAQSFSATFAPVGSATATSGTLTADLVEPGFTAPASGSLAIVLNSQTPGVSLTAYINGVQYGSTITTAYSSQAGSYEGGTESVNVSGYTAPFTLEEKVVYTGTTFNGGLTSGDGILNLTTPVPEPTALIAAALLLVLPLAASAQRILRKKHTA